MVTDSFHFHLDHFFLFALSKEEVINIAHMTPQALKFRLVSENARQKKNRVIPQRFSRKYSPCPLSFDDILVA